MQRIPSTQALRALESFSRLGTVWQAADDLHVTRSAVSHQLRLLERERGIELFHRVGTRIALSSRGQSYAKDIRSALRLIQESASRHAGDGLSGQLYAGFRGILAEPENRKLSHNLPRYHALDSYTSAVG